MPKSLHNARLKRGSTDSLRASVTLGVCDLLCIRLNGSLAQPHAWNGAHESMFCCLSETLFYHQLFLSHIFHLFHSTDFSAFIHSHVSHIFKIWRLFFSHTSPGFSLVALLFIAIILDKHTAATIWTSSPGTGSPDFCHHILLYLLKERSERFEHLINTTVMTQISVWLKNCKDSSAHDAAEAQFGWSVKWGRLNVLNAAIKWSRQREEPKRFVSLVCFHGCSIQKLMGSSLCLVIGPPGNIWLQTTLFFVNILLWLLKCCPWLMIFLRSPTIPSLFCRPRFPCLISLKYHCH